MAGIVIGFFAPAIMGAGNQVPANVTGLLVGSRIGRADEGKEGADSGAD